MRWLSLTSTEYSLVVLNTENHNIEKYKHESVTSTIFILWSFRYDICVFNLGKILQ